MLLCALDEGAFNLKILRQRKRVNIKLANDKPILTLYWMILEDNSTTVTLAVTGAGTMINIKNYVVSLTKQSHRN